MRILSSLPALLEEEQVEDMTRCQLYCHYMTNCSTVTFDTVNLVCSLYPEITTNDKPHKVNVIKYANFYMSTKACVLSRINKDLFEVDWDFKGPSFLIKSSQRCLHVVDLIVDIYLEWGSCSHQYWWSQSGNMTHKVFRFGENRDSSNDAYPIYISTDQHIYHQKGNGKRHRYMLKCTKEVTANTSTQFTVQSSILKNNTYSLRTAHHKPVFLSGDLSPTFEQISIQFMQERLCKSFSVKNGFIANPKTLFLPGDIIKIECKEGFELRDMQYNHVATLELVCGNVHFSNLHTCRKIQVLPTSDSKDINSSELYLVVLYLMLFS